MKKKLIIGLFGLKGAGKTTAADYLVKEHGFNKVSFKSGLIKELKEKFPDLLKETANQYDGLGVDDLFQTKPPLVRALMQNYGTEVRRGDDPDYWVKIAEETIKKTPGPIVVDDVRFFNELVMLTERDAIFFRIKQEGVELDTDHQSETEQEKFYSDFMIEAGNGSHDVLYKGLDSALADMKSNND